MTERPTRAAHLAQCNTFAIALAEYVREMHERLKWAVDQWEPKPCPPRDEFR